MLALMPTDTILLRLCNAEHYTAPWALLSTRNGSALNVCLKHHTQQQW